MLNSKDTYKKELEKIARDLLGPTSEEKIGNDSFQLRVRIVYKNKANKIRPIDTNDGTGNSPRGRYN